LVGRCHFAESRFLRAGKGAENTKEKSRAVLYVSSQDEAEVRELTWNFISSLALSFLLLLFFLIEL
jgi:hypothetical protein